MFLKTKSIQGPKGLQPACAPNYCCCEEREDFFFGCHGPAGSFFWWSQYCLELSCSAVTQRTSEVSGFFVCSVQCPGRKQQPEISWPDCVTMEAINQIILPAREYCLRSLSKCQLEVEEANKELPVSCWNRLRKLYYSLKRSFAALTLIFCWLIMSSSINCSFSLACVPVRFVNTSELCFVCPAFIPWECGRITGPSSGFRNCCKGKMIGVFKALRMDYGKIILVGYLHALFE